MIPGVLRDEKSPQPHCTWRVHTNRPYRWFWHFSISIGPSCRPSACAPAAQGLLFQGRAQLGKVLLVFVMISPVHVPSRRAFPLIISAPVEAKIEALYNVNTFLPICAEISS